MNYSTLYTNFFNDTLNLGTVLGVMFAYTVVYIPLIVYIDRIMPGVYGTPLPFYFPLMVRIKVENSIITE